MKKWKSVLLRLPIYLVLVAVVGLGLWNLLKQVGLPEQLQEILPTELPPGEQGVPPEELVDNIIGIGDTVTVYGDEFTGHLELTVNAAKFVTDPLDCPEEWMYECTSIWAYPEDSGDFDYDHWFLPGGPLDRGGKLVQVDVSITNVDAVAYVQEGDKLDPSNPHAFFFEEDFFSHNFMLYLTDLSEMDQHGNIPWFHVEGHSDARKFVQEDDIRTLGTESFVLKIPMGQTVQLSMFFPVSTKHNGTSRDPAYLFGFVQGKEINDPYTYIDLNLEETP